MRIENHRRYEMNGMGNVLMGGGSPIISRASLVEIIAGRVTPSSGARELQSADEFASRFAVNRSRLAFFDRGGDGDHRVAPFFLGRNVIPVITRPPHGLTVRFPLFGIGSGSEEGQSSSPEIRLRIGDPVGRHFFRDDEFRMPRSPHLVQ